MRFLHDGAPAHFSIAVRNHLDATHPGRWIRRGGPVAWPPRSPDLNPLDFFFWGHLNNIGGSRSTDRRHFSRHRQHTGYVCTRPAILTLSVSSVQ
ncbi:hypothetical protein AVEN_258019-1 [Araneus ventricosus]|uniref:Tc1-like transposase DDE domain-containing protein n=1 Tax=Araneus ventricosus TaxID=182803 RepID=A0A4Y2NT04_ARAVE|nr:hypothetical protein AVEN_258019-1 [Araneus ventricosus]